MARKSSLLLYGLTVVFVLLQLIWGQKYRRFYLPLLWLLVNVAPLIYLALTNRPRVRSSYLLGYGIVLVLTLLGQRAMLLAQGTGAEAYLMISTGWLLLAQGLVWFAGRETVDPTQAAERDAPLDRETLLRIRGELIAQDRTEEALVLLRQLTGLVIPEREEVALITARNAALSRRINTNLVDAESAGRERAAINTAVLAFTARLLAE